MVLGYGTGDDNLEQPKTEAGTEITVKQHR